jgi:hypothetical protein
VDIFTRVQQAILLDPGIAVNIFTGGQEAILLHLGNAAGIFTRPGICCGYIH